MFNYNKVFFNKILVTLSFLFLLAGFVFLGQSNTAQSQTEDFSKCENLKDTSDRLECFEIVLRGMRDKRSTPYKISPASPSQLDESTRAAVEPSGLNGKFDDFGKPVEKREIEEEDMTANVTKFNEDANGKIMFYLDNGQVWKETDGSYLKIPGSIKDIGKVTIYKGSFGGYRIKVINNAKDGRVKRLK
ncbi:MAG: hypothetical protein ACKVIX_07000 [Sphingomonadales bacterium]